MVDTTALVGSARVGAARVGSLGDTPPSRVRVHGACWELVADQAAIDAAKDHVAEREQVVRDDLALLAQEKADAAKDAAVQAAGEAATAADEALEAALGEMVEGKSNVFIQDVPPVESMQRQGVLWIDTSLITLDGQQVPGNVPRTWVDGQWVAVQDAAATDAVEKAAEAQARAAQAAADAQAAYAAADAAEAASQAATGAAATAEQAADAAAQDARDALTQAQQAGSNVSAAQAAADAAQAAADTAASQAETAGTAASQADARAAQAAADAAQALLDAARAAQEAEDAAGSAGSSAGSAAEAAREAAEAHAAAEAAATEAAQAMAEARYAPRTADRAPAPADGVDKPVGAVWWQYGETTNHQGITADRLTQAWMWTGAQWIRLGMDPAILPVVDIGTGTVGDLTGDRITVTGDLSARVVNAMSLNAKEAVITEGLTANAATLIGQTVVDDINVQGKLIGTDGVFTGTVDFENINVTDQVLAERLAGEHIYGTVVEGGEIRTTDGLPGQVILSDEGFVEPGDQTRYPGIRIIPPDTSELVTPPGMGPNENGFIITGGRNLEGGRGFSIYAPTQAAVVFRKGDARSDVVAADGYAGVTAHDGNGNRGEIIARSTYGQVRATAADGTAGVIQATPSSARVLTKDPGGNVMSQIKSNGREAYLWSTGSDGLGRILSVDSDGVWVKVQRGDGSGFWDHYNLTKTANDSDWIRFNAHSGISTQNNPGLRNKGGIVWAAGYLTRPAGWPSGWTRVAGPFAEWLRPPTDMLKSLATAASQRGMVRMTQTGYLEVWWSEAVPGTYQVDISALSYPVD